MNIHITPSAVSVDTAANLLTFIELARDPSKLKAVVEQIKTAQEAASKEIEKAKIAQDAADKILAEAEKKEEKASQQLSAARTEAGKAAAAVAEAEAVRGQIAAERNKFDAWMATEREALANAKAVVNAAAEQNNKRDEAFASAEADLAKRVAQAVATQAAAEALQAEYKQKLSALKSVVG